MPAGIICDICGTAAPMREVECPGCDHGGMPLMEIVGGQLVPVPHASHMQQRPPETWFLIRSAMDGTEPMSVCGARCVISAVQQWTSALEVELSEEDMLKLLNGEGA